MAHICNLVEEFNGLVSKGPVVILALLLFTALCFHQPIALIYYPNIPHLFFYWMLVLVAINEVPAFIFLLDDLFFIAAQFFSLLVLYGFYDFPAAYL